MQLLMVCGGEGRGPGWVWFSLHLPLLIQKLAMDGGVTTTPLMSPLGMGHT